MLKRDDLQGFSAELTKIGDDWRNFAYHAARLMKDRKSDLVSFDDLRDLLCVCGEKERDLFGRMQKIKWYASAF